MNRRELFYEKLDEMEGNKNYLVLQEMINNIMDVLRDNAENPEGITRFDVYNWQRRYNVEELDGIQHLVYQQSGSKSSGKKVVLYEEVYDIIDRAHTVTKHGGQNLLQKEINQRYYGIAREVIQLYLSMCKDCQLKKSKQRRGLVVKPILSEEMNARCQVDLIDMQAQAFGEYRYILVYQDHLTKFVVLRALKSKTTEAVVRKLVKIFATFGAPRILHIDNGREFENKVVREVLAKWPECKMVHGKPRHSQAQGSVERANQDIENMLAAHLNENNSSNWVDALPIIQAAKNRRFHRGIEKSPYEVMFGRKMTMGIGGDGIYKESIEKNNDEDDLRKAFNVAEAQKMQEESEPMLEGEENVQPFTFTMDQPSTSAQPFTFTMEQPSTNAQSSLSRSSECAKLKKRQRCEIEELTPSTSSTFFFNIVILTLEPYQYEEPDFGAFYEKIQSSIEENREVARKTQKKQADQMLARSNVKFAAVPLGTNVAIPVPTFDRGKVDHRNIMGVVMQEDHGLYELGTTQGILLQRYTRNQFEPLAHQFMSPDQVPMQQTSVRTTSRMASTTGGQGYFMCNCTTGCHTHRCKCQKSSRICNSSCHTGRSCENMEDMPL